MVRAMALVGLVVVTGCSASTAQVASKRSSSPPASASPSVVAVTPSPTPTGASTDLPVSPVGFSCRLPVTTLTYGPETSTYQGGFITFPSGTYAADPNGTIAFNSGFFVTQQTPVLIGGPEPPFFDAAAGRWVPAAASQAAPDGLSYAYVSSQSAGVAVVVIADVVRGTEKSYRVAIPLAAAAQGIEVMDYDGAGVYFVVDLPENHPAGVWRLDVASGTVSQVASLDNVLAVRNGYAWTGAIDPHDPTPPRTPAIGTLFDTIGQVNLVSHATTNWYYTQGRSQYLMGFASGDRPIVVVSSPPDFSQDTAEVRLIDHANTSGGEDNGELVSGPSGLSLGNPQADGDRTWFGGVGGMYLYTSAGLQRVFAGGGNPKSAAGQISPAGFCR